MNNGSGDGACVDENDPMLNIVDNVGSGVTINGWQSTSSTKSGMLIIEEDDVLSYDGKIAACDEFFDDDDDDTEYSISSKGGCGRASTSNDIVVLSITFDRTSAASSVTKKIKIK